MKKNIINLAIVSCFTLTAISAFADSDRSMSNRSMSDRSMSVDSDSDSAGADRSRKSNSSRSNRSQQSDNAGAEKTRGSNRSGVETSGAYGTTMSDRSRQSNTSGSDDSEFTSKGNSKQRDYYKNYEYVRKSDSQDPVDSAKDAQAPGKVLNRDRLNIECNTTEGEDSAGTKGRGCQPTGS